MASGFFTIEQWKSPKRGAASQWVAFRHLSCPMTLSDAIRFLEEAGKPGFFRVVQTQRMIWAEKEGGKLRLRKWHANSPEALSRTAATFERDAGRWPVEAKRKGKIAATD